MFGADTRLVGWNRNFQTILDLPSELVAQHPTYMDYVRILAECGEFGTDDIEGELNRRLQDTDLELPLERTRPDAASLRCAGMRCRGLCRRVLERIEAALSGRSAAPQSVPASIRLRALPKSPQPKNRGAHRPTIRDRAEQIHGAGGPRCAGAIVRHATYACGVTLQDRQHPSDVLRAAGRLLPSC
jgi:hypothetical protein